MTRDALLQLWRIRHPWRMAAVTVLVVLGPAFIIGAYEVDASWAVGYFLPLVALGFGVCGYRLSRLRKRIVATGPHGSP
jgi:hypothetical protein